MARQDEAGLHRKVPRKPMGSLIGICATVLLYIWLSVISLIISDYRLAHGRETDNLGRLGQSLAAYTDNVLGSMSLAIHYLEAWLREHPEADPRFDARFVELTDIYRRGMGGKVDVRMVSESGGLFYIPSPSGAPLADVTDREYYLAQLPLAPGTFHFSKSVLSRVTGKWGIPISYRLATPSHGIFILFVALELDSLAPRYESALPGKTAAIEVVRDDGLVLDRSPFDDKALGTMAAKMPEGFLSAEAPVGDLPLTVRVSISAAEVMGLWRRNSALRVLMSSVITLVIIFLTAFSSRQWRRIGAYQADVEKLAKTDFLTGLDNRQEFFANLDAELTRGRRYGRDFGFVIADLDEFKSINDRFGHPEGDRVLVEFAAKFKATMRASDSCARIGGEEFAVILPETEREGTELMAERICAAARAVILPDGAHLTISAGGAVWLPGEESGDLLYSRADAALYAAKEAGRDRVVVR